jgi:histidine ammonia-lyase
VLSAYGLRPATFAAKDGLSLVNGTQFITGVGSLALEHGISCVKVAQPVAALSMLAMYGHTNAFDARVFATRPHVGSARVAEVMRRLVPRGSNNPTSKDVQDPYSIR